MKDVKISPVLNGWIVTVGCQSVVFQEKEVMIGELDRYISDSDKVEKDYMDKAQNKMKDEIIKIDSGFRVGNLWAVPTQKVEEIK